MRKQTNYNDIEYHTSSIEKFKTLFTNGFITLFHNKIDSNVNIASYPNLLNKLLINEEYFGKGSDDPPKQIAIELFQSLVRSLSDTDDLKQKLFVLYSNLKRNHNLNIIHRIIKKELSLDEIAELTPADLAEENRKKRRRIEMEKYMKEELIIDAIDDIGNGKNSKSPILNMSKVVFKKTNCQKKSTKEIELLTCLENLYNSISLSINKKLLIDLDIPVEIKFSDRKISDLLENDYYNCLCDFHNLKKKLDLV